MRGVIAARVGLIVVLATWSGCGAPDAGPDAAADDASPGADSDGAPVPDAGSGDQGADAEVTGPSDGAMAEVGAADVDGAVDTEVLPAPVGIFREATEELGLPIIYSSTASLVDVDMDGRVDLFIGGHTLHPESMTELFLNTGEGFVALGLADRLIGDVPLDPDVMMTSSVDLNGDGLPELLVGGYFDGRLQVLWNRGDLQFEPATVYESALHVGTKVASVDIFDLDRDGDLDLYVSLKYPDVGVLPAEYTHPNVILLSDGAEGFEPVGIEIGPAYACGSKQTFATLTIPRAVFGRPDLLYIANDFSFDCAYESDPTDFPSFVQPEGWSDVLTTFLYSMAIDYTFVSETGDTLVAISDLGRQLMVTFPAEGPPTVDPLLLTPELAYTGWGNMFVDVDNDGDRDLLVASGLPFSETKYLQFMAQMLAQDFVAEESKLFYFEALGDGTFADQSAEAGPWFEPGSGEWFGLAHGDINGDGCVDIVVTLRTIKDATPLVAATRVEILTNYIKDNDTFVYDGPGTRVLLNSCPAPENHWVGVVVPDVPGTVVALTLSDGTTAYESVKGLVSVGARSGGGRLHFGLGPTRTPVSATAHDSKGDVIASGAALEVDTYNVLPLAP